MLGKKWKITKVFVVSVAGGFLGKFIYDEYVKGTPAVDVAKGKIHNAKTKATNVAALFNKPVQQEITTDEEDEEVVDFDSEDK